MALTDPFSFQLYSARNFPPLEAQLGFVAAAGFTNVEPYGGLYGDPAGFAAQLKAAGLHARSGHFGLDQLETKFDTMVEAARILGIGTLIVPYVGGEDRGTDKASWQVFGARLHTIAAKLKDEGLRFAWHNHDFEFMPLADGSYPIEHILGDDLLWEADVAWIVRAKADPATWLRRFSGRVKLVHVKDIAPAGQKTDEDGWADVGTGIVDWKTLWGECVAAGAEIMVAEHDNPSDAVRFAKVSAAAMRALAAG